MGNANTDLIFLSAKPKFIGRKLPELLRFIGNYVLEVFYG